MTRLIAVAGRPQRADKLREVAAGIGAGDDIVPLLREAVDAAVLEVGADGTYWFVHPLLAEVLEQELLPEERATLHNRGDGPRDCGEGRSFGLRRNQSPQLDVRRRR